MVWKFGSAAAQEKHAQLKSRLEPLRKEEPTSAVQVVPKPAVDAPAARADERVEPVLEIQSEARNEPGTRVEPVLGAFSAPAANTLEREDPPEWEVPIPAQSVARDNPAEAAVGFIEVPVLFPEEPSATVMVEDDLPTDELSWGTPAFSGDPDELPDLRPLPPPPMEHLGLRHRSANTFGHALRFPAEDERQELWAEQRRDRGFDDTELWGLDDTFSRFILPRLKALRQHKLEPPNKTMELAVWYSLLDKMIRSFELLLPEGGGAWSRGTLNDRERAQLQEGLDLFRKYFFALCL
jgi:hypothetical protein